MTNSNKIDTIFIFILFSLAVERCNFNESLKNSLQIDGTAKTRLAEEVEHGKSVFQRFCNTCHVAPEIKMTDQYIFDNIFDRLPLPAEDYFKRYIQDSKLLKSGGDKYALEIDKMYNSDYEHIFKDSLSNEDINSLITYIKISTQNK